MSFLRITAALIVALTIQVFLGHLSRRAHFYVNPLTIVVVFVAIHGSPFAGMLSGSVAGFFQDSFSGQVLGISSFGKTLVGYIVGVLNIKLVIKSVFFMAPLIFLASCTEMLVGVLFDRIVQVQPVLSGRSILTVALGNALIGTALIKAGEKFAPVRK